MRIAIVTHKVVPGEGQGRVDYEIVREALRRGHQVVLIASAIALELHAHPAVLWEPVPVDSWPTQLVRNQVLALRSACRLKRHRANVDIVHANGFITWASSDVAVAHFVHSAWLRSPVHTVRTRRDLYGFYQWVFTALNARLERRAYRQARAIVAVSKLVRQELIDSGLPAERIRVVWNGVDLDEFHPGSVNRRELGLPENVPLILFVGDIRTSRKNLDTVLQAIAQMPDAHLAVVGSVSGSPYPKLAERLGVASRVHFLDFRRDMPQLMRAADVCVCPSRYEPFSLVVLEALASGVPVVTASTVGAAELVTPECGTVLPDPDNAPALATALREILESPEERACRGRIARAVAEQHSWKQMAAQYLALYEEIAAVSPK